LKKEESTGRPDSGRAFLKDIPLSPLNWAAQITFWSIALIGLSLDLWSKNAVFRWLQQKPDHSIPVIDGFLQMVVAENAGAAFGIARGQTQLLVSVSVVALLIIFVVFIFSQAERKMIHAVLGLLAAGVSGNLYDRVFNGGLVRDFIDVVYWPGRHWPAFNIADSMLCIGVGLMIILGLFTQTSAQKRVQQHK